MIVKLLSEPVDLFSAIFGSDNDEEPPASLGLLTQFHHLQISWRHQFDEGFRQDVMLTGGFTGLDFGLGETVKDLMGRFE